MKIEDKIKELIKEETGINVNLNSRKQNIIEIRALYYKLLKDNNPALTLEYIGETVNKTHASVIHSLRKYKMYEKFNTDLKQLEKTITSKIYSENMNTINDNETLKLELKKARNKIESLEYELEEKELLILNKNKYNFEIINDLNELLINTKGTEKFELIILRLNAFYEMNKNKQ